MVRRQRAAAGAGRRRVPNTRASAYLESGIVMSRCVAAEKQ
jgi:hypothetical protein